MDKLTLIRLIEEDVGGNGLHRHSREHYFPILTPVAYPMDNFIDKETDGDMPDEQDFSDRGKAEEEMLSVCNADSMLLKILTSMDDRDKIIFMYLLLREAGYDITHADCAKTLSLSRERYMVLVKIVKYKAGKLLQEGA